MPQQPISLEQKFSTLKVSTMAPATTSTMNTSSSICGKDVDSNSPFQTTSILVTPTKSEVDSESSFESQDDLSDQGEVSFPVSVVKLPTKSDHKLLEEEGMFEDEPLLKENPHRFVIFPIQDNDVSIRSSNTKAVAAKWLRLLTF
jgi:hypothetical protein